MGVENGGVCDDTCRLPVETIQPANDAAGGDGIEFVVGIWVKREDRLRLGGRGGTRGVVIVILLAAPCRASCDAPA